MTDRITLDPEATKLLRLALSTTSEGEREAALRKMIERMKRAGQAVRDAAREVADAEHALKIAREALKQAKAKHEEAKKDASWIQTSPPPDLVKRNAA